jgi:hypothetical protein
MSRAACPPCSTPSLSPANRVLKLFKVVFADPLDPMGIVREITRDEFVYQLTYSWGEFFF